MQQEIIEPGAVYHIFNRGNNKEDIFREATNYQYFLSKVRLFLLPYCDIYAYCLMPNHFHFLLRFKETEVINVKPPKYSSQPLSNLFNSYARSYNIFYNRTGSLFQEHFQRERVNTENYFRKVLIYIHTNPVHHGFTDHFKNYTWSSVNDYMISKSDIINFKYPLSIFDGKENMFSEHENKNNSLLGLEIIDDNIDLTG